MPTLKIDDNEHVVRVCRRNDTIRKEGRVVGAHPSALHLRLKVPPDNKPEKYLSAVYYEHFQCSEADRLQNCLKSLTFSPFSDDALIRLRAGVVRDFGVKHSNPLRVSHEANRSNAAYATIRGLPLQPKGELLNDLLQFSVVEIARVGDIRAAHRP